MTTLKFRPEITPVVVFQVKPVPPKTDWLARVLLPVAVVVKSVYNAGLIVVVVSIKFSVSVVPAPKKTLPALPTLSVVLWPGLAPFRLKLKCALLNVVVPLAVRVNTLVVSIEPVPGVTVPLIVLLLLEIVPVPVNKALLPKLNAPEPVAEPFVLVTTSVPLVIVVPPV